MKPGGYLILHLVDREKFDPIVPGGRPPLLKNPQKYASSRISDTVIDFVDFKYRGKYDFSQLNENKVKFKNYEIDLEEKGQAVHVSLVKKWGQTTVPYVFIGGELIGGDDDF